MYMCIIYVYIYDIYILYIYDCMYIYICILHIYICVSMTTTRFAESVFVFDREIHCHWEFDVLGAFFAPRHGDEMIF